MDYKKILYVDRFTGLKGGDLINYLRTCNPNAVFIVEASPEFFLRKSNSEIIFDRWSKEFHIENWKNDKNYSDHERIQTIDLYESHEDITAFSKITTSDIIKELEPYKGLNVTLSITHKFYIHRNDEANRPFIMIDSSNRARLYEYEEPSEYEYEFLALMTKGLSPRSIKRVRDVLRLKYAFDDKKVDEEFNRILENPDILNEVMNENPTTVDRTIRAFRVFNSLPDRFKEFWLNDLVMEKAYRRAFSTYEIC